MAASSAIRREVRWRVTGTTPWSDIQNCSPVAELRLEGLDRAKTYDVQVRDISACGAKSPWVMHTAVVPDVAPGNILLSDLYADTVTAQAAADAANAALADIASDGILSPNEKPSVIRDRDVIVAEQAGIDAQATAYGITTEKTAYDGKVSALTSYLATLTSPVLWSDLSGNTTIVGTTFRSKFADVYTTRQTLLNAIYAAAKAKADAAQGTANTAVGQVTQLPVINGGFDIAPTGYGWAAGSGMWITDTTGISPGVQPNCARRNGSAGTPTGVYRNAGRMGVDVGQIVRAQALIKAVGANGYCAVRISWLNDSQSEISLTQGNVVTGTTTAGSYVVGTAPSGARYARVELIANNHTAGYYLADNVLVTQYPKNVGEVPDGGGRYAVNQVDANGLAVVDFSQPGHVNKTQSYIGDDANYRRVAASYTDTSNRPTALYYGGLRTGDYFLARANATGTQPLATISDAGALAGKNVANLDVDIADGTNFRRIGSGYVDTSGRPYRLWNGSTIKDASDAVFSGDSLTRLGGRTLDNIADGGGRYAAAEAGADKTTGKSITVLTGRTLDNIADGGGRYAAAESGADKTAGKSLDVLVDGTNYRRVGAGYTDSSGRITKLWTGAAIKSVEDGVFSGDSITRLGGRTLDNIVDGGGRYAAVEAGADKTSNRTTLGDNVIVNPSGKNGGTDPHYVSGGTLQAYLHDGSLRASEVAGGSFLLSGTSSVQAIVYFNGAAWSAGFVRIPADPGDIWIGSLLVGDWGHGNSGSGKLEITYRASDGSALSFDATTIAAFDEYDIVPVTVISKPAPAGTAYLLFRLFCTMDGTNTNVLFQQASLRKATTADAGSGVRIGDQRNLVSSITRNLGITRSATALTANAGGAVDINAHTIQMGGARVSYSAKSNAVTGLATSASYYIYTRDNYAGGSPTWLAGTNQNVVNSYDDAYNAGVVTIPTSGSSGGGSGGGGISGCVAADMYLRRGLTARHLAERWRWWRPCILRGQDGWHFVRRRPRIQPQPCCTITMADGSTLICSLSTPITVRTGESILAPMVYGHDLFTDSGWQRVIDVELLPGERDVVRISTGGHSFLAGMHPHLRISTHNTIKA